MKELTIENYQELQPWIQIAGYEDCNANIVTMLMWKDPYPFFFEVHPHFAMAYFQIRETGQFYWYMPFCKEEHRKEAIDAMLQYSKAHDMPMRMTSVSKDWRNWLQRHYYGKILFHKEWDGKDYIYDRQQQETLAGKKMQKRRNHYNAFLKEYGGRYEYHALSPADFDDVFACLRRWQNAHEDLFGIKEEDAGIHFLLEHFEELGLSGGVITIDGQLEAFSIISPITEQMLDIHVEKANREIRGLYVAILKLYLEQADPIYTLLNREDDMGLASLAKAKHDMRPIRVPLKYSARFEDWMIRLPAEQDLEAIRSLWLKSFKDETQQTADFYFEHLYDPADCRIITTKDTLIAMCMIPKWKMSIQGEVQEIRFLEGVAVDPGFQNCGYLRLLMEHLDQEFPNEPMMLQAYDWDLYVPFGYTITHYGKQYLLSKIQGATDTGHFLAPEAANCARIYNQCMQRFDGWRIRDEAYFADFWLPYQECCGMQTWQYEKNGEINGYLSLHQEDRQIEIDEIMYVNEDALLEMLSLLQIKADTLIIHTHFQTKFKGHSQRVPLLMMKHAPTMQENRFISECI